MHNSTNKTDTVQADKPDRQKESDEKKLNTDVHFDDFISSQSFTNQYPQNNLKPELHHKFSSARHTQLSKQTGYQHVELTPEKEKELIRYNHISYLLYLLSFFTAGLTWIIPIFMNYYKRQEAKGTWLETHFDWQIKTFWYSIIMGVICVFLCFFGISGVGVGALIESGNLAIGSSLLFVLAGFIFLINILWHLYRIVRGWIALSDGRAI